VSSRNGATILHADLDAFYASVEQLLDPSLRNRPIAVGGGVVLAASYEARSFGVHAGMSGWRARQLCGDLLFVGGHFRRYQELGDQVMAVFHDFTPRVERVSIDEAFLDVAGAIGLFGPPEQIAAALRHRIRQEIGLPLSVGVARTKHLAKVASQVAKPDGLVVVDPANERGFLDPLPVRLVWGVGPTTERHLHEAGIHTIGQLADTGSSILSGLLGDKAGTKLADLSNNSDPRTVESPATSKSMGAQAALGRRQATPDLIHETLGYLVDRVAGRLRNRDRPGSLSPHALGDPVSHPARCHFDHADAHRSGRSTRSFGHGRQPGGTRDHPPGRVCLKPAPGAFIAARTALRPARNGGSTRIRDRSGEMGGGPLH
jgi:DNA polymerase-4